jgi:hypothetical protein
MAVNIILPQVVINTANRNAGVAIGENNQPNWHSHQKTNFGVGALFAINNIVIGNVDVIFDNDIIDAPISEVDPTQTAQNQQF